MADLYPNLQVFTPAPDTRIPQAPDQAPPSAVDLARAAFERDNEFVSNAVDEMAGVDPYKHEDGFDFVAAAKAADHMNYLDRYAGVFNQRAADALTAKINREQENDRTLAAAGVGGMLMSGAASLLSPVNLLPAGEAVTGAKEGLAALRSALHVGAAGAGAAALQETALHASQETRPMQDSIFAAAGGAVLGGLLGAGASKLLSRAERNALAPAITRDLYGPEVPGEFADPAVAMRDVVQAEHDRVAAANDSNPLAFAAAGADVPHEASLEDMTIAGKATAGAARETAFMNPGLRIFMHPFVTARRAGEKLLDWSLYLNKHFGPDGTATAPSVENLVLQHEGKYAGAIEQSHALWMDYRRSGGTMNKSQWWEEVGKAMQENDQHPVPSVANMASVFRRDVVTPLTQKAIEAGLLPKDVHVTTAESYFGRVWDRQKIIDTEPQFRGVIRDWLKGTLESDVARMKATRDRNLASIHSEIGDLTMPADERANLLRTLPAQLKQLQSDNGDFHALDEALSDMRREVQAAKDAGDKQRASTVGAQIKATVDAAGKEYADYVSKRFALQKRMARLRQNIVGREAEVERLRGKLADAEQANIERLHRLHASLSKLDAEIARNDPEKLAAGLADARTAFNRILERSNAAHDRLATRIAKLRDEAMKADAPDAPRRAAVPQELSDILAAARHPLPHNPETTMRAHPVRDMLRSLGGVEPGSRLAQELKAIGATPKTAPGLFKKGGISEADNLVASEWPIFANRAETDLAGRGYIKPDDIIAALHDEMHGAPWRSEDEQQALLEYEAHVQGRDSYRDVLEGMGIDVAKMSDDQIAERLGDVAFQREVIDHMESAPPPAGEGAYGADATQRVTQHEATVNARQERALELFEAAERRRIADLSRVADRIGQLEETDPEAAIQLLRETVDSRIGHTADLMEREAFRMDELSRRLDAADPKRVEARVKELRARAQKVEDDFAHRMDGIDAENGYKAYLDEIENNIANKLTGRDMSAGDLPHNMTITKRGPLNERVLGIEDRKVRPWLDMNAERGMGRFTRIMGAEVELARLFNDTPDLKNTLAKIDEEAASKRALLEVAPTKESLPAAHAAIDQRADALRSQILNDATLDDARRARAIENANAVRAAEHEKLDKTPTLTEADKVKMRREIEKQANKAKTDLSAMRDILRGTYLAEENNKPIARVLAMANVLEYVSKLGGVVLSSLNDAVRPMMIHGLAPYMADGIGPLIANLKAVKASRRDGLLGGALSERVTMGYVASYAEIADPYARKTVWERYASNMARVFSKYGNFILPWTDWVKTLNYMIAQKRVIDGVRNWGKLSENERAYLRLHHIDEMRAAQIVAQLDKHGQDIDGVTVANSRAWDDRAAREAFDGAMLTDTRTGIVTPGVGDKPLYMHDPIGRALLQFQSYAFASHQKILLRAMQGVERGVDGRAAGVLMGLTANVAMGMFVYWLKTVEAGREVSNNPGHWMAEGLDRSGIMSAFFLANNTLEKLSGYGAYGALSSLFPSKDQGLPASRYRDRNLTTVLAGPSGGLLNALQQVSLAMSRGRLSPADVRALKRLVPFNNVPEINAVLNHLALPSSVEAGQLQ